MKQFVIPVLFAASLVMVSCSDNEPDVPSDAIGLNMMIGDSGTTIGGSDVYINSSKNFTTSYCGIANLGKKGGFNRNPDLTQVAQEVAVTPGNYYQIMLARNIETVAGARAVPVNANFYNVYADSWIYDNENEIIGARISYTENYPDRRALPEWDSTEEVRMRLNDDVYLESATYSFPKGCQIDRNIDISNLNGTTLASNLKVKVNDNQITFSNSTYTPSCKARATLLVRYESVYTRVYLNVESSM